jgi:2-dehydro-3-deoxyphosphogluconate aldolase / (4S)-4-hydroxy-2-oxoglutarate aldolase
MAAPGVVERISACGVVAIVRLKSSDELVEVAAAIEAGGIDVIEFTVTTPGAFEVIRDATRRFGDKLVLGAGTVLDAETARTAIGAGARFIVSPNLRRETIEICHRYGVASLPGAFTPTEILSAWEWGADMVKVFPATALGPRYISDVLAPLPQVRLVPVGGVNAENTGAFIKAGAAGVGVGSNLVEAAAVAAKDWARLTSLAATYRAAVDAARG